MVEKNIDGVSIIIPVYNSENTIRRSIESILSQTYHNWELIIVDDGSTDNSLEVCLEYQSDDERIHIITCEHMGVSAARNKGISKAQFALIAFNDADDVWKSTKLEKQIIKMNSGDYGLVYCRYEYVTSTIQKYIPALDCTHESLDCDIFESLWDFNKIGTPTILVKKEVLDKVGLFSERLQSLEDWELVLRISKIYKIGFVDECLLIADYKKENGVNSRWKDQILTIIYLMNLYPEMNRSKKLEHIFRNLCKLNEEEKELFLKHYDIGKYISGYENELFIRLNRILRKETKTKKLYSLLLQDNILSDFIKPLLQTSCAKIGIYGAGEIGIIIGKLLKQKNYNIFIYYDRNINKVNGFKCLHPDKNTEKIDLLINSVEGIDINDISISMCEKKINIFDLLKK